MKNLINYIYLIDILSIDKEDGYYILKDKNTTYLFSEYNDRVNFNYIYNICLLLNQSSFFSYRFKKNIYNEIISKIEKKSYYLIDIGENFNFEVDFLDMLEFYRKSHYTLINNVRFQMNWDILWESKIDYLSMHILNNKVTNKDLFYLLNYYIGIAENALIYIRNLKTKFSLTIYDKICFTHRRVLVPNKKLYFYNPLNFYIDLEVRDIAEYIKSLYLNDLDYYSDLEYYLKTARLTPYSASLLYVRIVYPSLFFDYYESKKEEFYYKKFGDIKDFELFIKKTYELINSYVKIDKISWL